MQELVINNIITVIFMTLIGFTAKTAGLIEQAAGRYLTQLIMNITLPLLMLSSFTFELNRGLLLQSIMMLVISLAAISLAAFITWACTKQVAFKADEQTIFRFLISFGNTTFVGYPLCFLLFGEQGLFLATVFNVIHMGLMWTYGIGMFFQVQTKVDKLIALLKEPSFIAMIAGVLLAITQVKLPETIFQVFNLVGSTTIPLSFLLVGIMLDVTALKKPQLKMVFSVAGFRLAFIPALMLLALTLFNTPPLVLGVSMLMIGTPSAALAPSFAEKYNGNHELAAAGVLVTTAAAAVSLTVLSIFLS